MSTPTKETTTRAEVEEFLYEEAALLDEWRLEEWLELLTDDIQYSVPSTDTPDGEPDKTLFLIADDALRVRSRVDQLLGKTAWAENPRSRTRRMIGNVRIREAEEGQIRATSNFVVHRVRHDRVDAYVGRYEHLLVRENGTFRIRRRRAILDMESLREVGKVSFIL